MSWLIPSFLSDFLPVAPPPRRTLLGAKLSLLRQWRATELAQWRMCAPLSFTYRVRPPVAQAVCATGAPLKRCFDFSGANLMSHRFRPQRGQL